MAAWPLAALPRGLSAADVERLLARLRPGDRRRAPRELGIVPGTLENWVAKDRRQREGGDGRLSEDERAELVRLRQS